MLKVYSCGPTLYRKAHIGNLRVYINVSRILNNFTYLNKTAVKWVLNITDVGHLNAILEDKVLRAAMNEKVTPQEIVSRCFQQFKTDMELLKIKPSEIVFASDNILEQVKYIRAIMKRGLTRIDERGILINTSALNIDKTELVIDSVQDFLLMEV